MLWCLGQTLLTHDSSQELDDVLTAGKERKSKGWQQVTHTLCCDMMNFRHYYQLDFTVISAVGYLSFFLLLPKLYSQSAATIYYSFANLLGVLLLRIHS